MLKNVLILQGQSVTFRLLALLSPIKPYYSQQH